MNKRIAVFCTVVALAVSGALTQVAASPLLSQGMDSAAAGADGTSVVALSGR